MIENIIKEQAQYREKYKREDDYLLKLKTEAEGVSSIKYGDDTSHGTNNGDRMELATIKLAEARSEIAAKRIPRFEITAETCDWLFDKLKPEPASVMLLHIIGGLSYRDIAEKTGHSVGWVSGVINTAKKVLK